MSPEENMRREATLVGATHARSSDARDHIICWARKLTGEQGDHGLAGIAAQTEGRGVLTVAG